MLPVPGLLNRAKPRLLLDTNVCEKLYSPSHGFDRERLRRQLHDNYSIVVSPRSLLELLHGTANAELDEHLRRDQEKLKILVGAGTANVLPFPGEFALRMVLGVDSKVESLKPRDFVVWIDVALAARSLLDLFNGYVRLPGDDTHSHGLDPGVIADQIRGDREAYQNWLKFAKERTGGFGSPAAWAYLLGVCHGVRLTDMQNMYLAERLSAAFRYNETCFNLAAQNPTLNARKRSSDWGDFQQLFYLCDPSLYLLTADEGIRKNCRASDQSKRILLLSEL